MTISGDEPKGGAGLMKVLLVSAAAIVAAETLTVAQAADTALKKAPPVQHVRVCDIYGAGFFQLPGTVFCSAFRGQSQVDANFEAGKDAVFVQQDSKKNGDSYSVNVVPAGAQDESGWQVQAKPTFDLRTETTFAPCAQSFSRASPSTWVFSKRVRVRGLRPTRRRTVTGATPSGRVSRSAFRRRTRNFSTRRAYRSSQLVRQRPACCSPIPTTGPR
jgi:hypothetical protein